MMKNKTQQKENNNEQIEKKESKEEIQQAIQEKYMEYQMMQEQLTKMTEQRETLRKQEEDLDDIKGAIENIQKTRIGSEMFVPISSGIFVKAEIKETNQVLVNVGDNIIVPKTIADAVQLIQKQHNEIENYEKTVQQNIQILLLHQQRIENELYALTKSINEKG